MCSVSSSGTIVLGSSPYGLISMPPAAGFFFNGGVYSHSFPPSLSPQNLEGATIFG